MSPESPPNPTDRELDIMRVLWKLGSCNVREVLDELNSDRAEPFAYTTILRFLQIMTEKGLVERQVEGRSHFYQPSVPERQTKKKLVQNLLDRAFSGSPKDLVLHLLGDDKANKEGLSEIHKALKELENENNK